MDWRELQQKSARTRLDQAFTLMDTEYGVTRLLDPEGRSTRRPSQVNSHPSQIITPVPGQLAARPRLTPTRPRSTRRLSQVNSHPSQVNSPPVPR